MGRVVSSATKKEGTRREKSQKSRSASSPAWRGWERAQGLRPRFQVSAGPRRPYPAATPQDHRHPHLCPPGTARDRVPEPAPAGPAPLSPPPLSARSPPPRSGLDSLSSASPPGSRHKSPRRPPRPPPRARLRERGRGTAGSPGRRSAPSLTSGWRRGTQPVSVSYSSGPSAILVLNPSSRCMLGESVSALAGLGKAEGEREGEREPG